MCPTSQVAAVLALTLVLALVAHIDCAQEADVVFVEYTINDLDVSADDTWCPYAVVVCWAAARKADFC